MFIRYGSTKSGRLRKKAVVWEKADHGIAADKVSPEAKRIIDRLKKNGHSAYIVGGAVRDLLVGRRPKDFDIVTNATPARIKKLFWNARIIGRRFRLVHIFFDLDIYEVSTFRSTKEGTVGNEYGSIDEDVRRRDFSANALYYDPFEETIVDFVGGLKDIRHRRLRPLIDLKTMFVEDPVRMIRAAKYSAQTGFRVSWLTVAAIRRDAKLLAQTSPSRLSEEISKILASGKSLAIMERLMDYGLLRYFMPRLHEAVKLPGGRTGLRTVLKELDFKVAGQEAPLRLGRSLSCILVFLLGGQDQGPAEPLEKYKEMLRQAREALLPLNPPRVELEYAVRLVFRHNDWALPPKKNWQEASATRGRLGPRDRA